MHVMPTTLDQLSREQRELGPSVAMCFAEPCANRRVRDRGPRSHPLQRRGGSGTPGYSSETRPLNSLHSHPSQGREGWGTLAVAGGNATATATANAGVLRCAQNDTGL